MIYKGSMPNLPNGFVLDKHHNIETGRIFPVCGNTYRMLHDSRFAQHFEFIGNFEQHFGLFEGCGSSIPFDANTGGSVQVGAGACC